MQRLNSSILLIMLALWAQPSIAQEATSHLLITVMDSEGRSLPGVTLELTGLGATRLEMTDQGGRARFLRLDPGTGAIKATLDGFASVERPNLRIGLGSDSAIYLEMLPEVRESIVVTDQRLLLDSKELAAGVNLSQIEIDKVPTTRNPWDLMTRAPGVVSDRINVGGSESYDQYASPRTPGTSNSENSVLLDGGDVTDMSSLELGSQMFFDLDQVTELQLATGGADVTKSTAGVAINFVTKRGTNDFRGSARFEVTDRDGLLFFDRSEPNLSSEALAPSQESFIPGSVEKIEQWGFEAGGAVVRDRLWLWGSYGVKDGTYSSSGSAREAPLPMASEHSYASIKANAQVTPGNSAVASWNTSDRNEDARGAGPTRPLPTAWAFRGPAAQLKIEDTHIFNSSLFVTGGYVETDTGFALVSNAVKTEGSDAPQAHFGADGVWKGSQLGFNPVSSGRAFRADGAYFFHTSEVSHELKFGARLREFESESAFTWANDNAWSVDHPDFEQPFVITQRGLGTPVAQDYTSIWLQDTMALERLTVSAGLRYDLQEGSNLPSQIEGNLWLPDFHPALSYAGAEAPFDWETISPRVGLTYAMGDQRSTLLRASFARFAQQLRWTHVNRLNPASYSYTSLYWFDFDGSGDFNGATAIMLPDGSSVPSGRPGPDAVVALRFDNWDPRNPTALETANRTHPGLDPELTDELLLSVEHAVRPEFVIGATATIRRTSDILEERALVRAAGSGDPGRVVGRDDFALLGEIEGSVPTTSDPYSVDVWGLRPDLEFTGGTLLTNGDRERTYHGLTLSATKRLTNRWMARGYLQLGEAEWDVPASFFETQSPNRCADDRSFGCNGANGGAIDGGLFAAESGFNRGSWSQSDWQFNLSGMYQVAPDQPWGFNVATNIFGRQGYPLPYRVRAGTSKQTHNLLAFDQVDAFRLEDVHLVDLRLDKEFAASGNASFTVAVDVFNVFNETPVLDRERDLSVGQADWVSETLGPRIWRLGVRLNWR